MEDSFNPSLGSRVTALDGKAWDGAFDGPTTEGKGEERGSDIDTEHCPPGHISVVIERTVV